MHSLCEALGMSKRELLLTLSSQEITDWIAYFQVKDWLRQGWGGKDGGSKRAFEFARSVHSIFVDRHFDETGRLVGAV